MTVHSLLPTRQTLHGHWSPQLPPVLTIDPGDHVHLATLDATWGIERLATAWPWKQLEGRDPVRDAGHCLIGPIAVRGARTGQTLAVHIEQIVPGAWAWTWSAPEQERAAALGLRHAQPFGMMWSIDRDRKTATDQRGRCIALAPFLGVMGVAPPEPGIHSTTPPSIWGGNMDCRELVAGSTLYLPIGVDGALFSCGDGHALQGDGEVCGNAIECPMERVELHFEILERPLAAPRARTPAGWVTLGFGSTLDDASAMALSGMLHLMQELYGLGRQEALAWASLVVDTRVTQVVNHTVGAHCILKEPNPLG